MASVEDVEATLGVEEGWEDAGPAAVLSLPLDGDFHDLAFECGGATPGTPALLRRFRVVVEHGGAAPAGALVWDVHSVKGTA
jgi:hypothetical protein